jgi:hypothetical protein
MDIKIQYHNVDHLRSLAIVAQAVMTSDLGVALHGTEDQFGVDALATFCSSNNIRVMFFDFSGRKQNAEALLFRVGTHGWLIAVNEEVLNLRPEAQAVYLKSLFCHELAHIVHKHSGALLTPKDPTDLNAVIRAVWTYAPYLVNAKERELAAEVFAAALGFWPHADFVRLVKRKRADFRSIANIYKMPVDCAVKWALIQFHDQLKMHYIKRDEDSKQITDHYGPDLIKDIGIDVFGLPWTAAHEASTTQMDSAKLDRAGDGSKYACVAFYEKKEAGFLRTSNKVIVAGFSRQDFESFSM